MSICYKVTVQTGSKLEAFFAAFSRKPECNGANTLAECVAHSEAYWNRRAQALHVHALRGGVDSNVTSHTCASLDVLSIDIIPSPDIIKNNKNIVLF